MMRNRPLTWVGVAGFEPAASSSRTERAGQQNRCLTALPHVRGDGGGHDKASDRV
jgi:hypothetical protein